MTDHAIDQREELRGQLLIAFSALEAVAENVANGILTLEQNTMEHLRDMMQSAHKDLTYISQLAEHIRTNSIPAIISDERKTGVVVSRAVH